MGEWDQFDFAAMLAKAREEWLAAQTLFDTVSEPEMVDAAIHMIVAAEKKYSCLLRQAKGLGLMAEPL